MFLISSLSSAFLEDRIPTLPIRATSSIAQTNRDGFLFPFSSYVANRLEQQVFSLLVSLGVSSLFGLLSVFSIGSLYYVLLGYCQAC